MSNLDITLLEVAEEQLRWTRAAAMPQVRLAVEAALGNVDRRRAYELLDGIRTSTEVAKGAGVPKTTLSRWTRDWRNLGIANEVSTTKGARIRHLVSLAALDIPIEDVAGEVLA
jgi:hypothetical protein